MPFTVNGPETISLPPYNDILWPEQHLKWPRDQATQDVIDTLDRQIRDIVGPDIVVEKFMGCMGAMLIFWEVKEPSDEQLLLLEKLEGIAEIQMDGIDGSISYD